ncbi:MAG: hypothetical protein EZS28_049914, partial [Streblomastix strix]
TDGTFMIQLKSTKRIPYMTKNERNSIAETLGLNFHVISVTLLKRQYRKDPTIDTEFLPDHERELKEEEERARLAEQYEKEMTKQKQEKIDVTFSMWDGSGHRRQITVTKGTTIMPYYIIQELLLIINMIISSSFNSLS